MAWCNCITAYRPNDAGLYLLISPMYVMAAVGGVAAKLAVPLNVPLPDE